MKHVHYSDVELETPKEEGIKNLKVRWLISDKDGAENFAADILFPCRLVRHHAFGGGHDRHAQPVVDGFHRFGVQIGPTTGLADPLDIDDRMPLRCRILQVDAQDTLFTVADEFVIADVAGFLENLGDFRF